MRFFTGYKMREGAYIFCLNCNKKFICRKDMVKRRKFCSTKCRSELKSKEHSKILYCAFCKKKIKRVLSKIRSKSKLYFCCRKCKDSAQNLDNKILIISCYKNGIYSYRKRIKFKCIRCGYDEFATSIIAHHKDGNRKNNKRNNLISLCSNCHTALHRKKWSLTDII